MFIEVAVTHFVDADKELKLRARGISALELDYSDHDKTTWTWQELETRLFEQIKGKRWLVNRKAEHQAKVDHDERAARVAPLLRRRVWEEEKRLREEDAAEKYEPKYVFRFDTTGYYSTCRVLLSEACVSTNPENPSDKGLKAAFERKMAELGGVYSGKRRNYEFPSSEDNFLRVAKGLFRCNATERKYRLTAPQKDKEQLQHLL